MDNKTQILTLMAGLLLVTMLTSCRSQPPPASDYWLPVDRTGQVLAADALGDHHCIFDTRTGLMWEAKRLQPGPHHAGDTYSWHDPDPNSHAGDAGLIDGGECSIARCDTDALVSAVNQAGLCGHHDWMLPGREQLMTLGDRRLARSDGGSIDARFFPHDPSGEYWTSSTFRLYAQTAWVVDSRLGLDRTELKTEPRPARLVRRHAPPAGHRSNE